MAYLSSNHRFLKISGLTALVLLTAIIASGQGLSDFMSINETVSIEDPDINMSFNQDGELLWLENQGETVDLDAQNNFSHEFDDEKEWYSFQITLNLDFEDGTDPDDINSFEFRALENGGTIDDSCNVSIDSDQESCVLTPEQLTRGFEVEFDTQNSAEITGDTHLTLEAN